MPARVVPVASLLKTCYAPSVAMHPPTSNQKDRHKSAIKQAPRMCHERILFPPLTCAMRCGGVYRNHFKLQQQQRLIARPCMPSNSASSQPRVWATGWSAYSTHPAKLAKAASCCKHAHASSTQPKASHLQAVPTPTAGVTHCTAPSLSPTARQKFLLLPAYTAPQR